MPRYQILIEQSFSRPVQDIFRALADHNNMAKLFGAPVKRIVDGLGDVNGVDSVRQIGFWPMAVQETVRAYVPHSRIEYQVTQGGFPMSKHRGQMRFSSLGEGCRLNWQIDFEMPPLIGDVVTAVLKSVLTKGVRSLT
jgi:uncharacterized protein YndB with AHSA1/START domain